MPVTVVVGGQYGSEGKGKVAALIARKSDRICAVRCGGPNSGHTTEFRGELRVLRQLPSAIDHPTAVLGIAAGCVIDERVLLAEINECRLPPERLIVDPRAILCNEADRLAEQRLRELYGGTASGNGSALARRVLRTDDVMLVADSIPIRRHARVEPLAPFLHEWIESGCDVLIEGTQGFGLSLLHSPHYPYVTSKDTTAAMFVAEVGLAPHAVDEVVLVIRTFPIRVPGDSGPLPGEISWEALAVASGAPKAEPELTSVSRAVRRVGHFDLDIVRLACMYNQPTSIAVMGLDRLDYRNRSAKNLIELTASARAFVDRLEDELNVPVRWIGTGFLVGEAFEVHGKSQEAARSA